LTEAIQVGYRYR